MELKLGLSFDIKLDTNLQITNEEHSVVQTALEFFANKPHIQFDFKVNQIRSFLGISALKNNLLPRGDDSGQNEYPPEEQEWHEEVIIISPTEMKSLDPDEKCGLLIGEVIFISSIVPQKYWPVVVLNLAVLRRSKNENTSLSKILNIDGLGLDMDKHWTANLVDLAAAEALFDYDKKSFAEYLVWRKNVERTDFFRNEKIDQILTTKLKQLNYKQSTHPIKRNWRTAKSWLEAQNLAGKGEAADELMDTFNTGKCDVLIQKAKSADNFDAIKMVELLDFLIGTIHKDNIVTVPNGLGLDPQAYLLTEDIAGAQAILIPSGHTSNVYRLESNATRTLRAMKDKLIYFIGSSVKKIGGKTDTSSVLFLSRQTDTLKAGIKLLENLETKSDNISAKQAEESLTTLNYLLTQMLEIVAINKSMQCALNDLIKTQLGVIHNELLPTSITQEDKSYARIKAELEIWKIRLESRIETLLV